MTRVHGLDLARALALLGMMFAHLGPANALMSAYIGPTNPVTEGYPSALFAVLAGVSVGIIARRVMPVSGGAGAVDADSLLRSRFRLIIRGTILFGIGTVLAAVQHGMGEVLTAIGLSYLLLTPVITWSNRGLAVLLALGVVLGPLISMADNLLNIDWSDDWMATLIFGAYPLLAWLSYQVAGLLIYRLVVRVAAISEPERAPARREVWLAVGGLSLLAVIRGLAALLEFSTDPADPAAAPGFYLQGDPHTGGLLDVLSATAAASMVIGLCLLLCRLRAVVWVTYPLRAMGSMSMTVYVVHVIVTNIAWGTFLTVESVYGGGTVPSSSLSTSLEVLWSFDVQALGFLAFASLWRWRFRRGPLEWGMHKTIESTVGGTPRAVTL